MIVTFVSECHKNSLKETRRILDAYAHRIGRRTWQTIITEQGLQAVRSKLARTARKSTAVACHRVRGSRRSELIWVVGNKRLFDSTGHVAVNRTKRDLLREQDENDWKYLDVLKGVVGIAALLHDFGKAWDPFQKMLKEKNPKPENREPLRHEWVSLWLFLALVDERQDSDWLDELQGLATATEKVRKQLSNRVIEQARELGKEKFPIHERCSPLVAWIAWLIVSHHRKPDLSDAISSSSDRLRDAMNLLGQVTVACGYERLAANFDWKKHWKFEHGLPFLSQAWCKLATRYAGKLKDQLSTAQTGLNICQRSLHTLSLLALVQGDHQHSSKDRDKDWPPGYDRWANTYRFDVKDRSTGRVLIAAGTKKQKLDEHLAGVCRASVNVVHLLPSLESQSPSVQDNRPLRKPAQGRFRWQNKAVDQLRAWQESNPNNSGGFFGLNMASTGQGKTFANAKIMNAISSDGLRYALALGLRTLTLQTGDEYRQRLGLDINELSVLIGSAAVQSLHEQSVQEIAPEREELALEFSGSESAGDYDSDFQFDFDSPFASEVFSTLLERSKQQQLIASPILVCTIDHLMPAVEAVKGGRGNLPMLRLLTSDLVIDEVDDFDHLDMPAISRLVHMAGMFGRRILLSSATIPPAVAQGLFHAYREGWQQFSAARGRESNVTAFWTDEFKSELETISTESEFAEEHKKFCVSRAKKLESREPVAARAIVRLTVANSDVERNLEEQWFEQTAQAAFDLHRWHAMLDTESGKQWSVGVVRMANVEPCIAFAKYLLSSELPEDLSVRVIVYHARRVLLIRSAIERHLDQVLCRKDGRCPTQHPIIRQHLKNSNRPHTVFIVVASPAAEVGRDHDYDWAVIEPSSMRSIIQMAGRVRRHRAGLPNDASQNIALPEFNFKAFTKPDAKVVFHHPGYEGGDSKRCESLRLESKSLLAAIDYVSLAESIDSRPRILAPDEPEPTKRLRDLEHRVLQSVMTDGNFGPAYVQGWTQSAYYLSNLAQMHSRFRASRPQMKFKLHIDESGECVFCHEPDRGDQPPGKKASHLVNPIDLQGVQSDRLWLPLDYGELVDEQMQRLDRSRTRVCEQFGELTLDNHEGETKFQWHPDLGAMKKVR